MHIYTKTFQVLQRLSSSERICSCYIRNDYWETSLQSLYCPGNTFIKFQKMKNFHFLVPLVAGKLTCSDGEVLRKTSKQEKYCLGITDVGVKGLD